MMVEQVKVKQLMQQMVGLEEVISCLEDQKEDVGVIKGTRTTLSGLINVRIRRLPVVLKSRAYTIGADYF